MARPLTNRRFVYLLALVGLATASRTEFAAEAQPLDLAKRPVTLSEAIFQALVQLDAPKDDSPHVINSGPDPFFRTKSDLKHDYLSPCQDAIDLLVRTDQPVNEVLRSLVRSSPSLGVRYRASRILVERRAPGTAALLEKMCGSDAADERYLACETYAYGIRERKLEPPTDGAPYMALYTAEKDSEVRACITRFLGTARIRAAAEPLLEALRTETDGWETIWALGELRAKEAVPLIEQAFNAHHNTPGDFNGYCHLEALGKIGTPDAVDFVVKHIDHCGAIDALLASKSEKALAALRNHLQQLKSKTGDRFEIAETRIAIARLSEDDPRESLTAIAEKTDEDCKVRYLALCALRDMDSAPHHARILNVYTRTDDPDIRRSCIRLLEDSTEEGVTEAMMDHAMSPTRDRGDAGYFTRNELLEALNKRLGTSFRTMDEMCAHIQALQGRPRRQ